MVGLSQKDLGTFWQGSKTTPLHCRLFQHGGTSPQLSQGSVLMEIMHFDAKGSRCSWGQQMDREIDTRLIETMTNVIDNKVLSATWGQLHTSFRKKQPKNPQKSDAMRLAGQPERELPPIPIPTPIPLQGRDLLLQLPGSRPKCLLCLDDLLAMQQCVCHCRGNI